MGTNKPLNKWYFAAALIIVAVITIGASVGLFIYTGAVAFPAAVIVLGTVTAIGIFALFLYTR